MAQPVEGDVITKSVGRPKITLSDLPHDWRERTLHEMGMGASREEIYMWLDIHPETFQRLMRDEKEFSKTIKRGELLSKAWWLNVGRTQLRNKDFSYVGWYMNMKNRFGWQDKQTIDANVQMVQPIIDLPKLKATDDTNEDS